jgi:hypothetical protein
VNEEEEEEKSPKLTKEPSFVTICSISPKEKGGTSRQIN